jgi:hypothetical protein
VESSRKLRRELTYAVAQLHGLQQSAELTLDDTSAKALALQVREQAGVCLKLLDHYQASVPGRMWSDAELKCRPLREELRRTEKFFRSSAGEWERRMASPSLYLPDDRPWDGPSGPGPGLAPADAGPRDELAETDVTPDVPTSPSHVEARHGQSLDNLMALVDDIVEREGARAAGPLRFTLPIGGDSPEQNMLVLVPAETGLVYEHRYGGFSCRHAEIEGFLVPAWAHPDAKEALDALFLADLGGNGVRPDDRSDALGRVGDALRLIWYRGTGDRMAPLQIDEERADELDQAWVPVLTPDGPAYLAWTNSD